MTKEEDLHSFWSGFELPAFEENSVPTGEFAPEFPYITYQVSTDSFGGEVTLTASMWDRGTNWRLLNSKTEEISRGIGLSGRVIQCDNGAIWIKRGSPFAQSTGDESDPLIKRKYLNISAEFLTAD